MGDTYYNCPHIERKKEESYFLSVKSRRENLKIIQYGSFCLDCKKELEKENKIAKNSREEKLWIFG